MPTRALHLVTALVLAATLLALPATAHAVADKDCGDFDTQAAAQEFFENNNPDEDPHYLDADGDGIACESLPCPCSTGGGGGGDGDDADQPKVRKTRAKVVRVIDGDTVLVKPRQGARGTIRLLGIDTPEVYGGAECHGKLASRAAKKLLPRGTRVLLVSDPTQDLKDRYGRYLRYVMKRGHDVGQRLVHRGHAKVYVYGGNPFKRVKAYRGRQASAKNHDRGLWGHC